MTELAIHAFDALHCTQANHTDMGLPLLLTVFNYIKLYCTHTSYILYTVHVCVSQQKLTQDKPGQSEEREDILAVVLEQNTKLQVKVKGLTTQLADQEKEFSSCKAQLQQKEGELQRLKLLLEQVGKPLTAPIGMQESCVDTDHDHNLHSLQQQHDNVQNIAKERDDLAIEVSRMYEENKILRGRLECVTTQSSGSEEIKKLSEQAKYLEVEYQTEKNDNEQLRAENKRLQQQLDTPLVTETELSALPSEGESHDKVTIGRLQARIKQLADDVSKLREHSKGQSRQILRLRQQTEISKVNVLNFVIKPLHRYVCLLYTSPSPRDATLSRMPSSA